MKRTIYLLPILVFAGIVNLCKAQISNAPVLVSSNPAPFGYKAYYVGWDTTGFNPGAGGSDLTWDFSKDTIDLGSINLAEYVQVISPSSAPGDSFPTSNFCVEEVAGSSPVYEFFILNDYGFSDTGGNNKAYTIAKVQMGFPMTYQEILPTTYQLVGQSVQNDTLNYDAFGTLITPFATFTNTARIKETSNGSSQPQYEWWSTDPIFPILTMNPESGSAYFIPQTALGINPARDIQTLQIFPNPSAGKSTLSFNLQENASVNISMFDISGREVRQLFNGNLNAGTNQVQVDDANLAPGMYFLSVQTDGQAQRVKYIKL